MFSEGSQMKTPESLETLRLRAGVSGGAAAMLYFLSAVNNNFSDIGVFTTFWHCQHIHCAIIVFIAFLSGFVANELKI